jgi:hypothetical protein
MWRRYRKPERMDGIRPRATQLLDLSTTTGKPFMKTISTKVDESVYQKLTESCGKSGNCISEKIRNLIEKSLDLDFHTSTEFKNEHESHYDKYGHYYTFDKNRQIWKCTLNPKNVRIKV